MGVPDAQVGFDDRRLGDGDLQHVFFWHAVAPGNDELFTPVMEKGAQLEKAVAFGLFLKAGRQGSGGAGGGGGRSGSGSSNNLRSLTRGAQSGHHEVQKERQSLTPRASTNHTWS